MKVKSAAVLTGALLLASLSALSPELFATGGAPVEAQDKAPEKEPAPTSAKLTDCEMTFSLKGWSAFYKTARGQGTIKCDNGQSAKVTIKVTGGGITFGKSEIVDGNGKFSEVKSIDEIFGAYAQGEAHAGVVNSAAASVLTKGEVSLALAGTGQGVDIGIDFSKFTIERAATARAPKGGSEEPAQKK